MAEVPSSQTQLDRIESGVRELNERMARLEERQHSQGAKLEAHETHITDHSQRLRAVELSHAVAEATGSQQHRRLLGRWAALGAVVLTFASIAGGWLARVFFP